MISEEATLERNVEPDFEVDNKLDPREIEKIINWTHIQFPDMDFEYIVSDLDNYRHAKVTGQAGKILPNSNQRIRATRSNREPVIEEQDISPEEKKLREQDNLRMVATLFCKGELEYEIAKVYIPILERQKHRSMLLSIVYAAFNELVKFLRKECNIAINTLAEHQKVAIKTQLLKIHEWMKSQNNEAFEAFLKFISRKFLERHKMITVPEATNLFKVIDQRVNATGRSFDLTSLEPETDEFGNRICEMDPSIQVPPSVEHEDQIFKIVGQLFLETPSARNVSIKMLNNNNLDQRWEQPQITILLGKMIEKGLKKLQSFRRRGAGNVNKFLINEDLVNLIQTPQHQNVQYGLIQVYLSKMTNKKTIHSLTAHVNSLALQIQQSSREIQHSSREISEGIRGNGEEEVKEEVKEEQNFVRDPEELRIQENEEHHHERLSQENSERMELNGEGFESEWQEVQRSVSEWEEVQMDTGRRRSESEYFFDDDDDYEGGQE